jgi:hypothetical protein
MDPAEKLDEIVDDYALAWDDAIGEETSGAAAPVAAPVETAPAEPAGDVVEPAPVAAAPAAEPAPVAPPQPSAEMVQLQQQILQLTTQIESLKAAPQNAKTEAALDQAEDELKWLEGEFASDWPDIKRAIDIVKKMVSKTAEGQVQKVSDVVTPLVQQQQAQAFYSDLKRVVPDIDTVRDGFIGWVRSQPETLRKSYTSIVETGTPEDTAALISLYKQVSGVATAPVPPTPPTPPATASSRLRGMEDIGSRKTATTAPAGALDYDAAFAEAARDPSIR